MRAVERWSKGYDLNALAACGVTDGDLSRLVEVGWARRSRHRKVYKGTAWQLLNIGRLTPESARDFILAGLTVLRLEDA